MTSKKITKNGGFTIPKILRTEAGLFPGAAVDISRENDSLVIKPHVPTCRFCGSVENVRSVLNTEICHECAKKIAKECLNNDNNSED